MALVKDLAKDLVRARRRGAAYSVTEQEHLGAIETTWPIFKEALWSLLWEYRKWVLFRVRIMGITFKTWTLGPAVRPLFERFLGDPPFDWKTGPQ